MDIRCIVAGGRGFDDWHMLLRALDHYFGEAITRGDTVTIISGTAKGADQMGEDYAKYRDLPVERYPADWNTHGRAAGYYRNVEMAKTATHLIAFWDGVSKGTQHMINIGNKHNLEVRTVKYG